jgi:hypothetical protein
MRSWLFSQWNHFYDIFLPIRHRQAEGLLYPILAAHHTPVYILRPMKFRDRVLERLAEMVTGDNPLFPYRSSRFITGFFKRCGFDFVHDGWTRRLWTKDRLIELNLGTSHAHDLPSDDLVRIISELFDQDDFEEALNRLLAREGLAAYFDLSGRCYVRNTGTGINSSTLPQQPGPLSREEIAKAAEAN